MRPRIQENKDSGTVTLLTPYLSGPCALYQYVIEHPGQRVQKVFVLADNHEFGTCRKRPDSSTIEDVLNVMPTQVPINVFLESDPDPEATYTQTAWQGAGVDFMLKYQNPANNPWPNVRFMGIDARLQLNFKKKVTEGLHAYLLYLQNSSDFWAAWQRLFPKRADTAPDIQYLQQKITGSLQKTLQLGTAEQAWQVLTAWGPMQTAWQKLDPSVVTVIQNFTRHNLKEHVMQLQAAIRRLLADWSSAQAAFEAWKLFMYIQDLYIDTYALTNLLSSHSPNTIIYTGSVHSDTYRMFFNQLSAQNVGYEAFLTSKSVNDTPVSERQGCVPVPQGELIFITQ